MREAFNYDLHKRSSYFAVFLVCTFLLVLSLYSGLFRQNRITVDAPSFYAYLPAAIVHQDLRLDFVEDDKEYYKDKLWYYRIENDQKLIKHPVGFSVVMSPFFFMGHLYAKATGAVADGYSAPYQAFMCVGVLIYLAIGLLFLRLVLLRYFEDQVAAILMLAVVLATNLLYYSTYEALMTHGVSFSFLSATLYYFFRWRDLEKGKDLVIFLTICGFILLIRPLSVTILLFFPVHLLLSVGIKTSYSLLKKDLRSLLLGFAIIFLTGSIQLLYWKHATGSWVYDVYKNELFLPLDPEFFKFLFGFRKGLFIYTPFLLLLIPGLVLAFKRKRDLFWSVLVMFIVTVYSLSSWWAWSYGISWGMRPMIDTYPFLLLPVGFVISEFYNSKFRYPLYALLLIFTALNFFQTWQYRKGLIHYDDMTFDAYFTGFFQTEKSARWEDALSQYNWRRRVRGEEQIEYSEKQFKSLTAKDTVFIRGFNQLYVSASPRSEFIVACYFSEITEYEKFLVHHVSEDTIAIRTTGGRYLSWKPNVHDLVVADSPLITATEKFRYEYVPGTGNQFRLKAGNGKYLTPDQGFPHILRATLSEAFFQGTFRFFRIGDRQKNF